MQVLAYVNRVKDVTSNVDHQTFTRADVESNDVRCPDSAAAESMYRGKSYMLRDSFLICLHLRGKALSEIQLAAGCSADAALCCQLEPINASARVCCAVIDDIRKKGDSCGGEVTCVIRACPKGLGSPVFDKLEAELAKALMSLPASKVPFLKSCRP